MSRRFTELVKLEKSGELAEGEALRACTTVDCSVEPSRTRQAFAEDADINRIVERHLKGDFSMAAVDVQGRQAAFGDFSEGIDFMEAQNRILRAQEAFQGLPARVRDRFRNDPAELVEFLSDEANHAEAVELGLKVPRVVAPVAPADSGGPGGPVAQ